MNSQRALILSLTFVILSGCSTRQVYDSIHGREKVQCQSLPQNEYEECMQQVDESYDNYKKNRDELKK